MLRDRRKARVLEDVLDRHAEDLLEGRDTTDELVEEYGQALPSLAGLLDLARRIYARLVPVNPSGEFVASLKARLEAQQISQMRAAAHWTARQRRWERFSRLLGVVISALALLALVAHIVGTLVMFILLVLGRRRRTVAAA